MPFGSEVRRGAEWQVHVMRLYDNIALNFGHHSEVEMQAITANLDSMRGVDEPDTTLINEINKLTHGYLLYWSLDDARN